MADRISVVLLARYLDGVATPDERRRVEQWIGFDPRRRAAMDAFRDGWLDDTRRLRWPYDVETVKARAIAELNRQRASRAEPSPRSRARTRRWKGWAGESAALPSWVRYARAAVLVLAIALGGTWWSVQRRQSARNLAHRTSPEQEYSTRAGQLATIDLRDGSRVVLAPGSRIRVPGSFNQKTRDVALIGQAYFVVQHDSLRPFRVLTATGAVEDLGTEFVVSAYPELQSTRVVVASGEVSLSRAPADSAIDLRAGDMGRIDRRGVATRVRGVNATSYVAWTRGGGLVFTGVDMREALASIGRWYDLDLRVDDSTLARRKLDATFYGQSSTGALQLIALALDAQYTRRGRTVVFHSSRSPRHR